LVVCTRTDGLWGFTFRNVIRCLLQANDLLVEELASIVHHHYAAFGGTVGTGGGFIDTTTIHWHFFGLLTQLTLEKGYSKKKKSKQVVKKIKRDSKHEAEEWSPPLHTSL
jgi:hypothetical protein